MFIGETTIARRITAKLHISLSNCVILSAMILICD